MKRLIDFLLSLLGLIIICPILIILSIWIVLDSSGPVFFVQERIGLYGKGFKLYKFRSMRPESHKNGLLTLGDNDFRITGSGYFLRKFKLDELPQLMNVLKGDMSFVGPRPEVSKYVSYYTNEQRKILNVRPGITDLASIKYRDESEMLSAQKNPEKYYVDFIMKDKIRLNLTHIHNKDPMKDIKIIFKTIAAILK